MKLPKTVDKLADLRAQMRRVEKEAKRCRDRIVQAGGAESKRWRAVVTEVKAFIAHYSDHSQVRLYRKKS